MATKRIACSATLLDVAELLKELAKLRQRVAQLEGQLAERDQQIAELQAEVRRREKGHKPQPNRRGEKKKQDRRRKPF